VTAADERRAGVGKRCRERLDGLVELGRRVGGRHEQRGLTDSGECGGVRAQPPFALQLGKDRRAVGDEEPPDLVGEREPGVLVRDFGDERLGDRVHGLDEARNRIGDAADRLADELPPDARKDLDALREQLSSQSP